MVSRKYAVVVGSMNCDVIYLQDRLPQRGETLQARGVSVVPGGKGANQAVQCAKLGMDTYMVAKVGRDNFGVFLKDELESYGVITKYIMTDDGQTGLAAVLTLPDGVYHSTVAPGSNFAITVAEIEALRSLIEGAALVIVQCEITHEATEYAIRMAHESGVYVLLNAAPARPISDACLSMVDCMIVNETEAAYYVGQPISSVEHAMQLAPELRKKVNDIVIITLGDKGSVLCTKEGVSYFAADETIKAIETTGSGDSYVGSFAFMKVNGSTDYEACDFASLVSQYTVTRIGGQPSMPTWRDIQGLWLKAKEA